MPTDINATDKTGDAVLDDLKERYGTLLNVEQLADLLGRQPHSLRTSLGQANHALAPLARKRRKIGRRVYFVFTDVADFINSQGEGVQ